MLFCMAASGCVYRGEGIFKKIGDSDFKASLNFMNMLVAAGGRSTHVCGTVLLEDKVTPVKNARIVLKKQDQTVVSRGSTDHIGGFNVSAIMPEDSYSLEIDSADYLGSKIIYVDPAKNNWHELVAHKR
ncbi:MAG: hypothetical protein A2075_08925 [Geobacteraceae bacterium GWC2_58_44]|nr:MAG: hypothetical protein A2075_08925 [Geobacteraceae bacterium GWC2_58_44]HBG04075.1 hypothetical protein [Geobacter sp.]